MILLRSVELDGVVDEDHRLVIEEELPIEGPRKVHVTISYEEEKTNAEKIRNINALFGAFKKPVDGMEF